MNTTTNISPYSVLRTVADVAGTPDAALVAATSYLLSAAGVLEKNTYAIDLLALAGSGY